MLAITWDVTDPAAWGAFLTGIAAVMGTWRSVKRIRKTDKDECDERVAEMERIFNQGFKTGMRVEVRREDPPAERRRGGNRGRPDPGG